MMMLMILMLVYCCLCLGPWRPEHRSSPTADGHSTGIGATRNRWPIQSEIFWTASFPHNKTPLSISLLLCSEILIVGFFVRVSIINYNLMSEGVHATNTCSSFCEQRRRRESILPVLDWGIRGCCGDGNDIGSWLVENQAGVPKDLSQKDRKLRTGGRGAA